MSTVRRSPSSRLHNSVVFAMLCLFAAVSAFAGVGQRAASVGASAVVRQDHAITRTDRAVSMQVVEKKHADLNGGGFPPALQAQGTSAQPVAEPLSLLLPIESSVAVVRQPSIVSARPRAPPAPASARA